MSHAVPPLHNGHNGHAAHNGHVAHNAPHGHHDDGLASRTSNATMNNGDPSNAEKGGAHYSHDSHPGGAPFYNRNVTPGGHPLDSTQPAFPVYHRRFANPAPLGLCGFALTTFMLSLINVGTNDVTVPNIVVGPALFYGGLAQLLAGMWEFATGNTFGATAFSSYGAFWLSYAFIVSPWAQIESAYAEVESTLPAAIGFFLFGWFIFTFIMFIASLRSSIALSSIFFFLTITFLLLSIAEYVPGTPAIKTAGGAFGLITAFNAWYVAAANLLTPDTSYFVLPTGPLGKKD